MIPSLDVDNVMAKVEEIADDLPNHKDILILITPFLLLDNPLIKPLQLRIGSELLKFLLWNFLNARLVH